MTTKTLTGTIDQNGCKQCQAHSKNPLLNNKLIMKSLNMSPKPQFHNEEST